MISYLKKRKKRKGSAGRIEDIRSGELRQIISLRSPKWKIVSDYLVNHPYVRRSLILLLIACVSWYSVPARANISNSYASTCLGDWKETQNASGIRSVDEGGSPDDYTNTNSALLHGGHGRIFCGGYVSTLPEGSRVVSRAVRLSIAFKEPGKVEVIPDYVNNEGALDGDLASSTASTSEIIANQKEEQEAEKQEEVKQEEVIKEENQEVTTSTEPVSYKYLLGKVAHAQESPTNESTPAPAPAPEPAPEPTPAPETIIAPEPAATVEAVPEIVIPDEFLPVAEPTPEPVITDPTPTDSQAIPLENQTKPVDAGPVPIATPTDTPSESPEVNTVIVAGEAPIVPTEETLTISYSINGTDWYDLDEIKSGDNQTDITINLPEIAESDIANLQISVQATGALSSDVYLDSLWLATMYDKIPEENVGNKDETDVPEGYQEVPFVLLPPASDTEESVGDLSCKAEPFSIEVKRGDTYGTKTKIKLSNVTPGVERRLSLPKMNPYTYAYFDEVSSGDEYATLHVVAKEYATPGSSSYLVRYSAPGDTNLSASETTCQLNIIVI